MTQKRKHRLNRIIRKEYQHFDTMLIGKANSDRIITQLFNLLLVKIEYLYFNSFIDDEEKIFMKTCNINYLFYYHRLIAKIYD